MIDFLLLLVYFIERSIFSMIRRNRGVTRERPESKNDILARDEPHELTRHTSSSSSRPIVDDTPK